MTRREAAPATAGDTLRQTIERQRRAADPEASAWVSANAGTGKTYVLVARVLALLLSGATRPDRILCLTYTKAAAAEMSNRLFDRMARWTTLEVAKLDQELGELLGRKPSEAETRRARTLFAEAIETPGGLKVQTIHAFAERLLQRFPLEAGVPPGFSVLDEDQRRELIRSAVDAVLTGVAGRSGRELAGALDKVVAFAVGDRFDEVVTRLVERRREVGRLLGRAEDESEDFDRFEAVRLRLARELGVRAGEDQETLALAAASILSDADITLTGSVLAGGSKSDAGRAAQLTAARQARSPEARVEALRTALLTKDGTPRQTLMTKALAEANPGLLVLLEGAAIELARLLRALRAVKVAEATAAMLRIADAAIGAYEASKQEEGLLDYDDLITKTSGLLAQSIDAQWVLYKLDGGLDHILVDEAQDTSPEAWTIVRSLADEFFAGAADADRVRTVFAVGDEKQSIYGFQGARPEAFSAHGRRFRLLADEANQAFHDVALDLSFRSVPAVLDTVDRVFRDRSRTPGLTAEALEIRHAARRSEEPGLIEIWPVEASAPTDRREPWLPGTEPEEAPPMRRLAVRIATCIRGWLDGREPLASEGRPIRAGDILILVRRRNPFAPEIIKALKAQDIAVAGADRIRIAEQIAVEDLIALGEFLLLPEDDLALAAVLKSPLAGLDDDDLLTIGLGRRGSLWSALLAVASSGPERLQRAAERLKRWRSRADYLPPFEFYASILDSDGLRRAMLERLGPEAGDAIDAFLNLALRFDEMHAPSLQGFLDFVRRAEPEIRRDMEQGRDEVRVMTVHGAKGLEAPIVFLPDTCLAAGGDRDPLVELETGPQPEAAARLFVWAIKGAGEVEAVSASRERSRHESRHEFHRLLYVALTRARDRLYVAGYEGSRKRPAGCWYDLIDEALSPILDEVQLEDGTMLRRYVDSEAISEAMPDADAIPVVTPASLPDWAWRRARPEEIRSIPLRPSQLAPIESEEGSGFAIAARPGEPPAESPSRNGGRDRFLRGTLAHALLQHLPELAPERRAAAAKAYLASTGPGLTAREQAGLIREVQAVIGEARFGAVFGPGSLAEVPIAGEITIPGGGVPLRITGQIDRLVIREADILLVDYKTNRPAPRALDAVPAAYLLQLAAYRLILRRIYPVKPIEAALLWTEIPRLMPIPGHILDMAERDLLSGVPWS
ncbi:MAG: double-strand break repair helicase AddA [Hyphomicrobiaceae bacterium]